jgi:hypothetical protein
VAGRRVVNNDAASEIGKQMTDYESMERGAELMKAMAFHALNGAIIEVSGAEQIETGKRIFEAYRQAIATLDVRTIVAYERLADERKENDRH